MPIRSKILPSPALVVPADTPTADCVRLMRQHDVGSLLIVHSEQKQELVGIFTERDLVKKIDLVQSGGHWRKPVRTVMTRPVTTIPLEDISQAPELMLAQRIRHLPVVDQDIKGGRFLVGVISMRDLFRSYVELSRGSSQGPSGAPRALRLGVISGDFRLLNLLKALPYPTSFEGLNCINTSFTELASLDAEKKDAFDLFIVDIDGLSLTQWPAGLKKINQTPKFPKTVILFNPAIHDPKMTKLVRTLSNSERFTVLAKPVSLIALAKALHGVEALPGLVLPPQ